MEKTRGVLKRFLSTNSKFGEENNKRQFILSCSTLYERMGSSDSISVLSSMFKNLEVIKSENMHTLPKNVKLEFIPVSDSAEDSNSSNE